MFTLPPKCGSIASMARRPKTAAPATTPPQLPPLSDDDLDPTFLDFLEAQGAGKMLDPLSDEGLKLQAQYIASLSSHPLDILRRISQNIFASPRDRIAAAKVLLEYSLRKPTQELQVNAEGLGLKIDASALSGLSTKELAILEKLLAKAQGGE